MLDNLDKNKNPFKVPENYFQNFNAEIMEKLPAKEIKTAKIVPLWKKVIPWTAVAAAFVGILFLTGILDQGSQSDPDSIPVTVSTSGIASSEEEDFYYSFLENEVVKAKYKEMLYNN
ncbi:MAG: hypothetical protein ACK5M3_17300 [Dysgonomonas sp.]